MLDSKVTKNGAVLELRIKRIAILFSGNGSNLEALIRNLHGKYFKKQGKFTPKDSQGFLIGGLEYEFIEATKEDQDAFRVEIVLALSNKAEAYGLERAKRLGVKTQVLESKNFAKREDFDKELVGILREYELDLCVLAGFMRILTPVFTSAIRAINIHPSLLPLFKGANGIKESFDSEMKLGGVSVHWVSEELDSGEIIAQGVIAKLESLEAYEAAIHQLEHCLYPLAVLEAISRDD
ncbi:phosphoribosylglycinamide formyltransferase [Helicobacter sp. 14348-15]|uniref:phosphoribosylglycinamide formyltransferase n=1 Tax=Helicobacter colisuis TaxID=2949739 RepID=UPI00202B3CD8|nr:phosphoribosylglycinamide formyltransferase [Helicobacter colisuis]MCL9821007.1 phosphoribosylglycinamide formyltransferase [Helicobacter colisuis]